MDKFELIRNMILEIGDDPDREGLVETPARVLQSWMELFSGYGYEPTELFKTFEDGSENYDQIILLKDIDFHSTCEHHILPFHGVAHVGYIPSKRIVGISKLARLVEVFSRRLQVQERLTTQIAYSVYDNLKPLATGCVIEAIHLCMACRGVKKRDAKMVTSALYGAFRNDPSTRAEFMALIGRR